MTTFSIVIPAYNVGEYIKKCLESIKNQTFEDFEVICVDDCGTDNTVEIIEEFTKSDSRFKLIRNEHNKGVSASRNVAIDNASGEYLVCVDPDDWLDTKALEKIYYGFEESNADSVWFNSSICMLEQNVFKPNFSGHSVLNHRGFIKLTPENLRCGTEYVWDKAYRLSKINELKLRFPEGVIFEDSEFHYKCFTQIRNIFYLDEILYYYRVRSQSLVQNARKGDVNIKDLFVVARHIYDYLKESGLFKEYAKDYLSLLGGYIKSVLMPNQYEKVCLLADDLLKYIDFPKAFEFVNTAEYKL